jgi:uncharacterized damage-inducible protein DinB
MEVKEVLIRSLNESWGYLTEATDGLTQEEIAWAPAPHCNSIAFIFWHVTRVEDIWIHPIIQRIAGVYWTQGWPERLGIPATEIGYQYTEEQLRAWSAPKLEDLQEYARAVHERTLTFVESLTSEKLLEVPREDHPDQTIGVILAHYITELAQHVGQVSYLRGVQRGLLTLRETDWT